MSNPKLALIPSGYKSGKVYSILPNDATGDFDFTRQSIGTRVRKDGLIEEAKTSGSITNEFLYSEDFTQSNWVNSNSTDSISSIVAPDGASLSTLLTSTASNGGLADFNEWSTAVKTASIYVKKNTSSTFRITNLSSPSNEIIFNLDTGTVQSVGGNFSGQIISLPNGWFRCVGTHQGTSSQTLGFTIPTSAQSVYIWGAMLSEGALSDYIKTEGSQVTETVETFTDVPRLDWYNSNCPSLLLESQRTNGFTYSEQFNQSAWFKSNSTITTNQIIAPNGTLTADLLTSTASGGGVYRFSSWNTTEKTASIFVKMSNSRLIEIFNASSSTNRVVFDLGNGIVDTEGGSMTGTIEDFGNGWYRLTATHTASASQSFGIKPEENESVYIWGAQIEDGSYASSYIKTEASTVTRLKDECFVEDSNLFDITEGTLFVDATPFKSGGGMEIQISDGTANNRHTIEYQGTGTSVRALTVTGGTTVFSDYNPLTFDTRNKLAITFADEDAIVFYVNGSRVYFEYDEVLPTGLNKLTFSNPNLTGTFMEGKIHDIRVYDRALTREEAEELTTL
jgi:uncharacterized protein involved in tolerance to divalent cations